MRNIVADLQDSEDLLQRLFCCYLFDRSNWELRLTHLQTYLTLSFLCG